MTTRRRRSLRSNAFSPLYIPGLLFWFDAGRITGLADTAPVPQWNDISGLGNHVAQATADNRPAYRTAQVNGLPAVSFDGTNDYLSFSTLSLVKNIGVFTLYAVTATGAISADKRLFVASTTAAANSKVLIGRGRGSATNTVGALGRRNDNDSNAEVNSAINAFANDAWTIQTTTFDWANSDLFVYVNGALVASSTSFQTDGVTSNFDSAAIVIGTNGNASGNFYPGKVAELIGAVDSSARLKTERYLSAKYGITLT
jgi:hypothetical protein